MTIEQTKAAIAVMQAYCLGERIQSKAKRNACWADNMNPFWNWKSLDYRVKPTPSVLWFHLKYGKFQVEEPDSLEGWTKFVESP
jgi:hypothetical protein